MDTETAERIADALFSNVADIDDHFPAYSPENKNALEKDVRFITERYRHYKMEGKLSFMDCARQARIDFLKSITT